MTVGGILSFMHCGRCIKSERKDRLAVGLTDPFTLRIWCAKCDTHVADFTLATPIEPRCDVCGEATVGMPHKH